MAIVQTVEEARIFGALGSKVFRKIELMSKSRITPSIDMNLTRDADLVVEATLATSTTSLSWDRDNKLSCFFEIPLF